MARGTGIDFPDLIIGTTALHLGFGVVTLNAKHFKAIPGLFVVQLQPSDRATGPPRLQSGAEMPRRLRVTLSLPSLPGRLRGNKLQKDLLIGATALYLGYSVATLNTRHFRLIPVVKLVVQV